MTEYSIRQIQKALENLESAGSQEGAPDISGGLGLNKIRIGLCQLFGFLEGDRKQFAEMVSNASYPDQFNPFLAQGTDMLTLAAQMLKAPDVHRFTASEWKLCSKTGLHIAPLSSWSLDYWEQPLSTWFRQNTRAGNFAAPDGLKDLNHPHVA